MKRFLWMFVFAIMGAAFLGAAAPAAAEGPLSLTHEASAKVPVKNNNFVVARNRAVSIALGTAVEEAFKEMMGEQKFEASRKDLKPFLKRPDRYVQSYRFLEAFDDPLEKTSEVSLEVTLFPNAVGQSLGQLGVPVGHESAKNVIVLIQEKSFTSEAQDSFWEVVPISETALIQNLREAGVPVLPRERVQNAVSEETVLSAVQGNMDDAVNVGLKSGADIVVLGNAASTQRPLGGGREMDAIQTSISVRAISALTSTVIAAKSDFASAEHEDPLAGELEAFGKVSDQIAAFLLPSIRRYWERGAAPQPPVTAAPRTTTAPPLPMNDL